MFTLQWNVITDTCNVKVKGCSFCLEGLHQISQLASILSVPHCALTLFSNTCNTEVFWLQVPYCHMASFLPFGTSLLPFMIGAVLWWMSGYQFCLNRRLNCKTNLRITSFSISRFQLQRIPVEKWTPPHPVGLICLCWMTTVHLFTSSVGRFKLLCNSWWCSRLLKL